MVNKLKKDGYSDYFAPIVFEERYKDFFKNKSATLHQKIWAQKRGFLSDKIKYFNLDNGNYLDYLSDFEYYKLHPINGRYGKWIDDKLTTKLVLQPFSDYLPMYYFHLYNNTVLKLADCPDILQPTIESVIELLIDRKKLAFKLLAGSRGVGFEKIECRSNDYFINNEKILPIDLREHLERLTSYKSNGYIVTEYITSHHMLSHFWSQSPNTVRLMVIRERNDKAKIVSGLIHFGTASSGIIDNAPSGGVACPIDTEFGTFDGGLFLREGSVLRCSIHPNSNKELKGRLPHWESIREVILEICDYLPELRYLGFDIVITEESFKILEINSHQGLLLSQYVIPIFKNEKLINFFTELLQEKGISRRN